MEFYFYFISFLGSFLGCAVHVCAVFSPFSQNQKKSNEKAIKNPFVPMSWLLFLLLQSVSNGCVFCLPFSTRIVRALKQWKLALCLPCNWIYRNNNGFTWHYTANTYTEQSIRISNSQPKQNVQCCHTLSHFYYFWCNIFCNIICVGHSSHGCGL